MNVSDLHVCLAVTGAAAAQGTSAVCHFLKREVGIEKLDVAVSRSAYRFVTQDAVFQSSGNVPLSEWDDYDRFGPGGHIRFASSIDLMIVLPASTNFVGALVSGQCYSPILMVALATSSPVAIVPSMNAQVWQNRIVQRNVDILRNDGIMVMENPAGLSLGADTMQPGADLSLPPMVREILDWVLSK